MKSLLIVVALVALAGCGEQRKPFSWVIDRRDVPSDELQRRFNVMAVNNFTPYIDDDLEESGHYVYFRRSMTPSESRTVLDMIRVDLEKH